MIAVDHFKSLIVDCLRRFGSFFLVPRFINWPNDKPQHRKVSASYFVSLHTVWFKITATPQIPMASSLILFCLTDEELPRSVTTGKMPEALKVAELPPVLKNLMLTTSNISNFRPIINLKMTSKVVEKVVAMQLMDHITSHQLDKWLQSAYKRNHSTETALIKVQGDRLPLAIGNLYFFHF